MKHKVQMKKEKYVAWFQIIKPYPSRDVTKVGSSPNTYQNEQRQEEELVILETYV